MPLVFRVYSCPKQSPAQELTTVPPPLVPPPLSESEVSQVNPQLSPAGSHRTPDELVQWDPLQRKKTNCFSYLQWQPRLLIETRAAVTKNPILGARGRAVEGNS